MPERPQFVDWATTEGEREELCTLFAAATPIAHPPYESHPVELALRMATASAGLRGRRPLENAAVFFVLLALPLSQRPFARWGYPHPRSDAVLICDGAGAHRNAASTPDAAKPGRIDATCGAAGGCTGSTAGCAQAPRSCRVVSAAGCLLLPSVATAAGRLLGIPIVWRCVGDVHRPRLTRAVICGGRFGPSRRKPVLGTVVSGCSHRRTDIAGATSAPTVFAAAAGGLSSVDNCRSLSVADAHRRFGVQGVVLLCSA